MTCAQIAIIPTNSAIDVKAAASSTNNLSMADLRIGLELACSVRKPKVGPSGTYEEQCSFSVLFVKMRQWVSLKNDPEINRLVNGLTIEAPHADNRGM